MYLVVRTIVPIMQEKGKGAIVTTGSISGIFGEPALSAYTASKAAVVNLTRSIAIDYAQSRHPGDLGLSGMGRHWVQ